MLIIYYGPMQRQAAKLSSVLPSLDVGGRVIQHFEPRTSEDNYSSVAAQLPCDLSLNLLPSPKMTPVSPQPPNARLQNVSVIKHLDRCPVGFSNLHRHWQNPTSSYLCLSGSNNFLILTLSLNVPHICGLRWLQPLMRTQRFHWKMAAQAPCHEMQLIDA